MSFGSNKLPPRFGKGKTTPKPWLCKCGRKPAWIAYCTRCDKGRPSG